jgi:hypothetical protein
MRGLLFLPLLLVLALDFATLEAPLVPTAQQRHVEADDEEESVPSRTLRVRRETPSPAEALPAHRYVASLAASPVPDRVARAARRRDPPPWVGRIVQARLSSAGSASASPPEDH